MKSFKTPYPNDQTSDGGENGSDLEIKKYHKGNFHHLVKIKDNLERDRRN